MTLSLTLFSALNATPLGPHSTFAPLPPTHKGPIPLLNLKWNSNKNVFLRERNVRFRSIRVKSVMNESWDDGRRYLDRVRDLARDVFEKLPEPAKRFPWTEAVCSFFGIVFELTLAVVKYLFVPLLAISSLSEMSYCAHERKMVVIPLPFLAGIAVAGALKQTVVEVSPDLKVERFPWHLLIMAVFFLLLKLPGPYYPYVGRLVVPHFANGGLWRTLWFAFQWHRRVPGASKPKESSAS